MSAHALEFIVPGDIESATGGYVYDRSIAAGLRALGWRVRVHALDASFPSATRDALAQAQRVLAELPDGACVLLDGLALGPMAQPIERHARRLNVVALMHMPRAAEFGTPPSLAEQLHQQELQALQFVGHVIVTSRITQRALTADGVDPARVSIVEPGVCTTPGARGPRSADGSIQLLCVATVQEGKGHGLLVDALAPLVHLPWHLRCVGSLSRSPTTVQGLTEQLRRRRLLDRVTLVGELPHAALGELYLAADLFVLPTLRESFCMAVAESLAHGLPVISTRTGAISELVGATAGLLIEPGDRDALRVALERTLTDGALRSSLRAGALAAGARLTPWPQACERMARVLEHVCAWPC